MDRDDEILNYVQNRMPEAARRVFETDMQEDPALRTEVDVLRAARAEFELEAVAHGAKAQGWERLSATIQSATTSRTPANDNRAPLRQILQMAAAALLAVGVWHFAVAPRFVGTQNPTFQTASQTSTDTQLQVVFNETATLGEISMVLLDLDGRLIGGPSALGVYTVGFENEAVRDAALVAMQDQNALFKTVLLP